MNGGAKLPFPNNSDDPPQLVLADVEKSLVLWPTKKVGKPTIILPNS